MNTDRLITALMLNDARNAGDTETYETMLESIDEKLLLSCNMELTHILLKIAAKARGMSVDELVSVLMLTAFSLSKEQDTNYE